eukprot:Skav201626  [mRNA]  locus=scaffold3582:42943:45757:+ [translate_table: standard]
MSAAARLGMKWTYVDPDAEAPELLKALPPIEPSLVAEKELPKVHLGAVVQLWAPVSVSNSEMLRRLILKRLCWSQLQEPLIQCLEAIRERRSKSTDESRGHFEGTREGLEGEVGLRPRSISGASSPAGGNHSTCGAGSVFEKMLADVEVELEEERRLRGCLQNEFEDMKAKKIQWQRLVR